MGVDLTSLPFENSLVLASALIAAVIGLLVTLRRGPWLTTMLFSAAFLAVAAFQAGTLGILHAATPESARAWGIYLGRTSALASALWLALTVVLGRKDPWEQIRNSGAYLTLALAGCIAMSFVAGSPQVVRGVSGRGSPAIILLGPLGKVYLLYLIIAMVAMLMNLERMLRNSQATTQKRLRPMFLALCLGIFTELILVSSGLLYGGLRVAWLVACSSPVFVAGVVTALSLARRRLSDLAVPAARPVIYYSSVSLTLAAGFLLAMGVLSKVFPSLSSEGKRTVSVGFYAIAGISGLVLVFSPRANRGIRRFIDRNFYANRYDYRREWERVSKSITPTARIEDIGRQIEGLVRGVFEAERVAIYVRRDPGGPLVQLHGPDAMPYELDRDNPLVVQLERTREPIVFRDAAMDVDQVPAAAENRDAIRALGAALCAPLMAGDVLIGTLWLSEKRNRENYSSEDVEFLGAMCRQLAAALWFARLAEQLAETRQLESLHRLSSYVLHDMKNHVSGLSLVLENARRHLANPEFQRDAMTVVDRTVKNLRELMNQVSVAVRAPDVHPERCEVRELLEEAVRFAGLALGDHDGVRVRIESTVGEPVRADRRLMSRVLVNLLTNAREAIGDSGSIVMGAAVEAGDADHGGQLSVSVHDTGRGMTEEFLRTRLFRPFSTTKAAGLGVGLAQCKSIVEAHGGSIGVDSRPGHGTTFHVRIPLEGPPAPRPLGLGLPDESADVPGIARGIAR